MNLIRSIISVFLAILVVISIAGWFWTGGQSSPKMGGARLVLALCGLSSLACLWLLWSARLDRSGGEELRPIQGS